MAGDCQLEILVCLRAMSYYRSRLCMEMVFSPLSLLELAECPERHSYRLSKTKSDGRRSCGKPNQTKQHVTAHGWTALDTKSLANGTEGFRRSRAASYLLHARLQIFGIVAQKTVERVLPFPEVSALVYGMRGHVHQLYVLVDLLAMNDCGLEKRSTAASVHIESFARFFGTHI